MFLFSKIPRRFKGPFPGLPGLGAVATGRVCQRIFFKVENSVISNMNLETRVKSCPTLVNIPELV